jgi:hypothetical protein
VRTPSAVPAIVTFLQFEGKPLQIVDRQGRENKTTKQHLNTDKIKHYLKALIYQK